VNRLVAVAVIVLIAGCARLLPGATGEAQPSEAVSAATPEASSQPTAPVDWTEPAAYSYRLFGTCGERGGVFGRFHVVVQDGEVVSFEGTDDTGRNHANRLTNEEVPTIAGLIGLAEEFRSAGAEGVTLETDPASGQPVALEVDRILEAVDDEECYYVEGVEAPEACGFAEGARLSYAGRATTAALDVQEVVGDPMSDDPADIYITRKKFDQGEHHGRLVCAIFVDVPGFVEITVHPEDGGRFTEPEPTPVITPTQLPPGFIEIVTHCGLAYPRIEYEGEVWKFDVVDDSGNPPEGWGFNTTVVEIRSGPSGPIVIGPDGSEWQLIPAAEGDSPGICM
jgi:hypothetical protein